MRNFLVLGCPAHQSLTDAICEILSLTPGRVDVTKFSNGETSVIIRNSVRECDVYVVSTAYGSVNDCLIELFITISACKTASARKVTAVLPLFPYSRQPDQAVFAKSGISLNQAVSIAQPGHLIADILTCAGADQVITMDLHDPQMQGFFDIPVDNLFGRSLLLHYMKLNIPNIQDAVIVSPDAGGAKRATAIADALGVGFTLIHQDRHHKASPRLNNTDSEDSPAASEESMIFVGNVQGKTTILIDDIVDTATTLSNAANLLKELGSTEIYAIVTHAILSGKACDRINSSAIKKLVVTNSVPQEKNLELCSKLEVLDVAPVFAEAIRRTYNGESISMLFKV